MSHFFSKLDRMGTNDKHYGIIQVLSLNNGEHLRTVWL
jgi:hypothetical protein